MMRDKGMPSASRMTDLTWVGVQTILFNGSSGTVKECLPCEQEVVGSILDHVKPKML